MASTPRVFSGIQPSGELHIGNYLGAVKNWVRLQDGHECIFSIVDLHAITQPYDPAELAQRTHDMAVGLLAAGIDPARSILFVQSHVAEHTELGWMLTTVTPLGELERQTAVQGEGAAPGERAGRSPQLPRAPGRRRAALPGDAGPGGRRPGAAPRADARDRAPLERPLRRRLLSRAAAAAHHREAGAGARRPGEDVEEPRATRSGCSSRPKRSGRSSGPRRPIRRARRARTRATPTSATSSRSTRASRRPPSRPTSRRTAAPPAGAASTASVCWRTI